MKEIRSPNLKPGEKPYMSFVLIQGAPQQFAKGGLVRSARRLAKAGRYGDNMLIHINRGEFEQLRKAWGEPTINPETGLPEYWLGSLISGITKAVTGSAAKKVLTNAALGALASTLTGGSVGKGALLGGLAGGIGAAGSAGKLGPLSGLASNLDIAGALMGSSAPTSVFTTAASSGSPVNNNLGMPMNLPGLTGVSSGVSKASGLSGALGKILAAAKAHPYITGALAATLLTRDRGRSAQNSGPPTAVNSDPNFGMRLPQLTLNRKRSIMPPLSQFLTYGQTAPEMNFYENNSIPTTQPLGLASGGHSTGPGTGRSDSIPARLSDGEYVIDAETVSMLGDGSNDAGAKALDAMRAAVRKHKGSALAKGKISPNAKHPLAYVKGVKK